MPKRSSTSLPSREALEGNTETSSSLSQTFTPADDEILQRRKIRTLKTSTPKPKPITSSTTSYLPPAPMSLRIQEQDFHPPLGRAKRMFDVNPVFFGEFKLLASRTSEVEPEKEEQVEEPVKEEAEEPISEPQPPKPPTVAPSPFAPPPKKEETEPVKEEEKSLPTDSSKLFSSPFTTTELTSSPMDNPFAQPQSNPFGQYQPMSSSEESSDEEEEKEEKETVVTSQTNPFASFSGNNPFANTSVSSPFKSQPPSENPFLSSPFASTATNPFASGGSSLKEEEGDEEKKEVEPSFKPVVDLPEQEKKTGEEDENVLMKADASVHGLKKNEDGKFGWVSRGIGEVSVNQSQDNSGRIVMRHKDTLKLIINSAIFKQLKYESPTEEKVILTLPVNTDIEDSVGSYLLKFRTKETCAKFKDAVEKVKNEKKAENEEC
ncbi:hypothetical protein P9112_003665 [Eukaryota sp. TZLM1-RC]